MSFFGNTPGQSGSTSGTGNNPNNSGGSWGSFLKQGLSQIESKLDKVLDMQVPIPSGGALSAFSPPSMSTLLASPEGMQGSGAAATGSGGSQYKNRDSADTRRSNVEGSTRPSGDKAAGGGGPDRGDADADETTLKRSASPKVGLGLQQSATATTTTAAAQRHSQDLRKSASITSLRQAAQQGTSGAGTGIGDSDGTRTPRDSGAGERPSLSSSVVEVDPVTGMVTAAPAPRVMSVSSPSPSPSASSATSPVASAAAAAAAASRERLENRMRGIFKKPAGGGGGAATPPASAASRASTEGSSVSPLLSSTPPPSLSSRTHPSPGPEPSPPLSKETQLLKSRTKQHSPTAVVPASTVDKEEEAGNSGEVAVAMAVKKDSLEEEEEGKHGSARNASVEEEGAEINGKQHKELGEAEDDSLESPSSAAVATATKADLTGENEEPTKSHLEKSEEVESTAAAEEEKEQDQEEEKGSTTAPEAPQSEEQAPAVDDTPRAKDDHANDVLVVGQVGEAESKQDDASKEHRAASPQEPEGQENVEESGVSAAASPSAPAVDLLTRDDSSEEEEKEEELVLEDKANGAASSHEDQRGSAVTVVKVATTSDDTPKAIHPAEAHLVKVVEQREQQLFKVMQEHSQLLERHRDLEDAKAAEQQLLSAKVAGLEGIIEQQKKELDMARSAAASNAGTPKSVQRTLDEQKRLLEEKDEQIRGLLAEGEVLSKKEFKNLTTIKTLRAKSIEVEKSQQDLQLKLEKAQANAMEAQAKVSRLTEEQRQLNESVRSLTDQNNRQSKQISKLEGELNQMREDKANLQLGLDRAWQELEEARKASDEMSTQAHQAAVEQERKVNEELQRELASIQQEHAAVVMQLRQEIQDLRVSLSNRDEAAGEMEDQLRAEIRGLQWRLEQTDGDAFEMQEAIEEARRPLQRQLESLQAQHHASVRNWERIEKQLTNRVQDAEEDLIKAQNREKAAKEKLDAMKTQTVGFEARLDTLRSADTQLRTELSATKRQCLEKEEALKIAQGELAKERLLRERAIEEAKEDESRRSRLAQQEETEKLKAKVKQLQQQLSAAKEEQLHQQNRSPRPESSSFVNTTNGGGGVQGYGTERASLDSATGSIDGVSMSRSNSVLGMMGGSKGFVTSPPPMGSPSIMGLGGASGSGGPAVAIERLSSMVRQLEGQVAFLNEQVRASNKSKDELSEELVKVSMELESLQDAATRVPSLEQELKQLQGRHAAALDLLGEKAEEVQELKADLADVKDAYRDQLNELLGQLEGYRKGAA